MGRSGSIRPAFPRATVGWSWVAATPLRQGTSSLARHSPYRSLALATRWFPSLACPDWSRGQLSLYVAHAAPYPWWPSSRSIHLDIYIFSNHLLAENRPKRSDTLAWSCDAEKAQEKSLAGLVVSTGLSEEVCYTTGDEWVGNVQNKKENGNRKQRPSGKSSGLGKQIPGFYFPLPFNLLCVIGQLA